MSQINTHAVDFDPFAEGALALTCATTEAQKEIWSSIQIHEKATCAFNESITLHLLGQLNIDELKSAINFLVNRHEALKTTFSEDGESLCIAESLNVDLTIVETAQQSLQEKLEQLLDDEAELGFDLQHGPLIRFTLLKTATDAQTTLTNETDQHYYLILTAHHIICDGWSLGILLFDLAKVYSAFVNSKMPEIEAAFPFSEYAQESETEINQQNDEAYWTQLFSQFTPAFELPTDLPRPGFRTFNAKRIDFSVDISVIEQSKQLASSLKSSLTSLMMAAFAVCLNRWSGEETLVIGIPSAAQPAYSPEGLVGHCVNLLPIPVQVNPQQTFDKLVTQLSDSVISAYEHQNYTFGSLLKKLQIKPDPSRIPLVPVLFNIDRGIQDGELPFAGLHTAFLSNPRHYENFEMFINAADYGNRFIIECQYNTDLFSAENIQARLKEFVTVLGEINQQYLSPSLEHTVNQSARAISQIKLLSRDDENLVIAQDNQTDIELPNTLLIHDNINLTAQKYADKIAAVAGEQHLSYVQLNNQSYQFARYLIDCGVTKGTLVGVSLERNEKMLVVLLGILKAGATYVPLDPQFPADRIAYMIDDAQLSFVVTQSDFGGIFSRVEHILLIDELAEKIVTLSDTPFDAQVNSDDLAYIIYTSGSTGKPKGVMVHHGAMMNFLFSMAQQPGITPQDVLLAVTTLSFDISILEIFLPLLAGACVVIANKNESTDGRQLIELIHKHAVTMMQATPATWQMLLLTQWQGKADLTALCGGEALAKDLAEKLLNKVKCLWNMYGPTETAVWSSCTQIIDSQHFGIGKPIANTRFYILDEALNPVPNGLAGELFIAGKGVSQGYLNRTDLTAEKFIADPYCQNEMMYRTGDLVKRQFNGELEYIGRLDNQVKIRGYRIELDEVEAVVRKYPEVIDCALAAKTHQAGDKRLVCYVVWKNIESAKSETNESAQANTLAQLTRFMRDWLPDYMIPQHLVSLESLPRMPNGKLNRKALPDVKLEKNHSSEFSAPQTDTEKWLAEQWSNILSVRKIGRDSDFFALGGHSLLIAHLIQQIASDKSIHLQYRDLFDYPQLYQLAERIDNFNQPLVANTHNIPKKDDDTANILSLAQQRLWYLDKLETGTVLYNLPSAFRFIGSLNIAALETSFQDMLTRHASLRTSFSEDAASPVQIIHEQLNFKLELTDLSEFAEHKESELHRQLNLLQSHVFKLTDAPLFLAKLFCLSETEHVLFFMPHHAIFDGWSFDIFLHELTTGYCQHIGQPTNSLPELPIQYTDYAHWLREYLSGDELNQQLQYWTENLAGNLPVLEMPLDKPRPEVASHLGEEIFFDIPEQAFEKIIALANQQGVSVFMVMLSIYSVLLYRYTGQKDLIIGAPMADRTRAGTENLIGFFVNALVLRIPILPDNSFSQLLQNVKEICLSGFANQDTPFEKIVEVLQPERDFSRAPLFQTSLTYQDVSARENHMGDIDIQQIEIPNHCAPLDINIWLKRRGNKISGAFVYNCALFERESIEQFSRHFISLVSRINDLTEQSLWQIPLLTKAEYEQEISRNHPPIKQWQTPSLLHELFDGAAELHAEKIAASCSGTTLQYAELQQKSNQFANYLNAQGIERGVMVGLCVDRSVNMLIAMLGILKAGAAYIPLDPEFPTERLDYMIQDASLDFVVTESAHLNKLSAVDKHIVIDDISQLINNLPNGLSFQAETTPDDIAYVIYTSGSTGNPKGVLVQHSAVVNFINSMSIKPGITADDKLLAVTTLSFDIAVLELYLPITNGAQVVIATRQEANDSRLLLKIFKQHSISIMQVTPATWRLLISSGWSGKSTDGDSQQAKLKALCGGEALPADLAATLTQRCDQLWNMYGPTETTVWSSCGMISELASASSHGTSENSVLNAVTNFSPDIGQAIDNTQLYVLDENLNPVPTGVSGELYIGGAGVTKGYLNQPELTEQRFIDNPISGSGKIYRTGDKARYLSDGRLLCLGRLDNQVKVRGYRIELGEIESAVRHHQSVQDCAVTVIGSDSGDVRLVCFVVWQSGHSHTVTEMRNFLRERLPQYMIPQHLVELSSLPQTPNLKLDRKALPSLFKAQNTQQRYVPPKTEMEKWLAALWCKIIGIDQVSRHDNFFDLGGHSLLSMQVINQISQEKNIDIHPRELLLENLSTIASKISESLLITTSNSQLENSKQKVSETSVAERHHLDDKNAKNSVLDKNSIKENQSGKNGIKRIFKKIFKS
ncbi:amino acid adenylation domain-containing protein [Aliikangiella maris]|uniref:Amino acid adenylation domain-containing protein n=2 Tax=Aliikangiella maris TaxID=3162458 RepID=A0ABV3MRA3_9GAMM